MSKPCEIVTQPSCVFVSCTEERVQQAAIAAVDQFCTDFERKIEKLGGIGFFLGGIRVYGGDPWISILIVPVGAVLLFLGVAVTAWGLMRSSV